MDKASGSAKNGFPEAALLDGPKPPQVRCAGMPISYICYCGMGIPPRPRLLRCGARWSWPPSAERFSQKKLAFHGSLIKLRGMSEVLLSFRGRQIGAAEVAFLREFISQDRGLSRRGLSLKVCEAWNWVQPNGQPRDMVCRGLLLALHRAGHIELPAKRHFPPNNAIAHRRVSEVQPYDTSPVEGSLASLQPLEIRLVRRAEGEKLFAHLLSRYHYLGYSRPVGEHLQNLVFSGARPVAWIGWGSAPRQLHFRDHFVGAPKEAYRHHLHLIAYNTRFLLLPWLRVPHLASHLLGRIARRISADWQDLYHHPICL